MQKTEADGIPGKKDLPGKKNGLNRKKLIKGVVFAALFLLLFVLSQRLLRGKWTNGDATTTMWAEYESLEEDTVDVLFMGTSHVYSAIDPMYIYENSGITSYAISAGAMRFDLTYTVLQEALKTQSPSVLFLDMSAVHYKEQVEEERIHPILDQLPWSLDKLDFILNSGNEDLTVLDALFPLFRYHSRWDELEEQDFRYMTGDVELTYTRGHFIKYKTTATEFEFYKEVNENKGNVTDYMRIPLQKIKDLCDENGIELILFKIPLPGWYEVQSQAAQQLADEIGVRYWELYYEIDEIGLDPATDYRDATDHLNQYGAEKLCAYLMNYLEENYELEDRRGSNERWDSDVILYEELKASLQG